MTRVYDPQNVYRVHRRDDGILLGELVNHRWAEETPGVEQACVYVAMVNSAGQIYIQHRTRTKRLWPDRKTISASGHVDPGETFEQAAVREVREELGIELTEGDLRPLGSFTGLPHCGRVYEVRSDASPAPRPAELDVEKSGFLPVSQVRRWMSDPDLFTPSGMRALAIWMFDRSRREGES